LYGGSGRYFFPQDNYDGTANSGLNYIMGIPFTCDQLNNNCTGTVTLNNSTAACTNVQNASSSGNNQNYGQAAWQYTLDGALVTSTGTYLNERLTTDPTVSTVTGSSATDTVFMVTSQPTSNPCSYGGQSRVWGLNCATGAAISDTTCNGYVVPNVNQNGSGGGGPGTLYLQTSTGAIYQINPNSSFKDTTTGNRTTQWFIMPPENAAPMVQSPTVPNRTGQLIQWMER
jgi:type IV pilus assembly protein PilY1